MKESVTVKTSLLHNPKVQQMARYLGNEMAFRKWLFPDLPDQFINVTVRQEVVSRVIVTGLIQIRATIDDVAPDGFLGDAILSDIDFMCGVPLIGEAMFRAGWVQQEVGGLKFPTPGAKEKAKPADPAPDDDVPKSVHIPDDFMEFWNAYPKKTGKGAALKAWKKIRPNKELLQRIINAIALQRRSDQWRKDRGQFIPHPATWLNAMQWDDVPDALAPIPEDGEAKRARQQKEAAERREKENATKATAAEVKAMIEKMKAGIGRKVE